ncbi:hypothetical protein Tco_1075880, partial [Tanacetum coccineum]
MMNAFKESRVESREMLLSIHHSLKMLLDIISKMNKNLEDEKIKINDKEKGKQRAKAYRGEEKLPKLIDEDKVQASPNYKAKIKKRLRTLASDPDSYPYLVHAAGMLRRRAVQGVVCGYRGCIITGHLKVDIFIALRYSIRSVLRRAAFLSSCFGSQGTRCNGVYAHTVSIYSKIGQHMKCIDALLLGCSLNVTRGSLCLDMRLEFEGVRIVALGC